MLDMSQVNDIRARHTQGESMRAIARDLGISRDTVKKYIDEEDFSPKPPVRERRPSGLDPYKDIILSWIEADRSVWRKQRHTAKRMHARLVSEHGFTGSYNMVQRFVKENRDRASREFLELCWEPGSAQADFGQADFIVRGERRRLHYFELSFPFSNMGYTQVFEGESAECVCQGLRDIFERTGGVPPVIVFDNAAGIGRRIADTVKVTELFSRFQAHHRFTARFCNVNAGHEKGNVESKVGYVRRNLFVPAPATDSIEDYNRHLLSLCEKDAGRPHYKKGSSIEALFAQDRARLLPLPLKPFDVVRYERVTADGYGKVCADGSHYYSTRPDLARKRITIGLRAGTVEVYDETGALICSHRRVFGKGRSDSSDAASMLASLSRKPGAWGESLIRRQCPEALREHLDACPRELLKSHLAVMRDAAGTHELPCVMRAMETIVSRGDIPNRSDVSVLAMRMEGFGLASPPDAGPDLTVYDSAFLGRVS